MSIYFLYHQAEIFFFSFYIDLLVAAGRVHQVVKSSLCSSHHSIFTVFLLMSGQVEHQIKDMERSETCCESRHDQMHN